MTTTAEVLPWFVIGKPLLALNLRKAFLQIRCLAGESTRVPDPHCRKPSPQPIGTEASDGISNRRTAT